MEYKDTTSLIRLQLSEALNAAADVLTPAMITPEYLIQRIPFLSEYRLVGQNPKHIHFTKDKYNSNVERIVPNRGSILFKNYNIFSDLHYYNDTEEVIFSRGTIRFNLLNEAVVIPKKEEDMHLSIVSRVLTMATKMAVKETSVHYAETKGAKLNGDMTIDKTKLDEIINNINAALFKLEEVSKDLEFNLFN